MGSCQTNKWTDVTCLGLSASLGVEHTEDENKSLIDFIVPASVHLF